MTSGKGELSNEDVAGRAMFWVKRLKTNEAEWLWTLSYGDLVSLLLAVFVMIAAMSKLQSDKQFDAVRGAMCAAFGFAPSPMAPQAAPEKRLSLLERLERAGLLASTTVQLGDGAAAPTDCQVVVDRERLILRFGGAGVFAPFSAALKPDAKGAMTEVAHILKEGRTQIEVCASGNAGVLPDNVPFRDAFDLAYARARAVADVLERAGVGRDRLRLAARSGAVPLIVDRSAPKPTDVNQYIEIIVHAIAADAHDGGIAEKDPTTAG